MCFYCGCREIPLIRDFIAEHETVTNLGAEAARALNAADYDTARALFAVMAAELAAHWQGEEDGLFRVMHGDEVYAGYIDRLETEHRELRDLLAGADVHAAADRRKLLAAVDDLQQHIAKEEDGLFPASLTALSAEQWDLAIDAWRRAHPRSAPDMKPLT